MKTKRGNDLLSYMIISFIMKTTSRRKHDSALPINSILEIGERDQGMLNDQLCSLYRTKVN